MGLETRARHKVQTPLLRGATRRPPAASGRLLKATRSIRSYPCRPAACLPSQPVSLRLSTCIIHSFGRLLLQPSAGAAGCPRASSPWEESCPRPEFPNGSGTLHCRRVSRIDWAGDSGEVAGPRAGAACRLAHQPGTWGTQHLRLHPPLVSRATGMIKPVLEAQLLASRERPGAWNRLPGSLPAVPTLPAAPGPTRGDSAGRAGPLTLMIRSPSFTPAFTAAPPARGGSGQRG